MKGAFFIAASAAILFVLGCVHLYYTFYGPAFEPRDPDLLAKMRTVSPVLTPETTMWRVWVGYNVSHSLGLLLFGAVFGYLAMRHSAFLFQSWFLLAVGFLLLLSLTVLARLYWFSSPFRGAALATVLYVIGVVVGRMK